MNASSRSLRDSFQPLKIILSTAMIVLGSGAVYLSALTFERQEMLAKVSRYNVAWSAGQGVNEFLRLRQRVSELAVREGSKHEAQLRFDIVKNRLELFRSGEFQPFVLEADDRRRTVELLSNFLHRAEMLIEQIENPATARALLSEMAPLEGELIGLAAEANNYGGQQVARDRQELLQLHWTFSALAGGLVLCTFVLIVVLERRNRLLIHAQQKLHALNAALVQTSEDLEKANSTAHAANDELITQNRLFDTALHNMSQGLCMFGEDRRLIVSNRRLATIYGLSPESLRPGSTFEDIIRLTVRTGVCSRDSAENIRSEQLGLIARKEQGTLLHELSDGRVISILHQPMNNEGWVATYDDITERHHAEAQMLHMARHDALTDLPNRILLRDRMWSELARCQRHQRCAAVFCLDLDHFKNVNDTLGHSMGDRLLREVATRVATLVRRGDTVARLGGDEFVILQTDVTQPADVDQLAQRVIKVLSEPYELDGHQVVIGVSVGVALTSGIADDPDTLLKNADLALYRAKEDGRGTFCLFQPEMAARLQRRRTIELDLRAADFDEEFDVVFQPIVNIHTLQVTTLEALLRWPRCRHGPVATEEIIAIAEDTGLIVNLGEWVLKRACLAAANLPGELNFAVNLSPMQFMRGDVVETVSRVLAATGVPPSRLELEVTETFLLEDSQRSSCALRDLRALGVRISLDDFGTGYSSLGYLRKYTVDKIKIDRSFVEQICTNQDHRAIVHAIVRLAHALGMKTTAEGIETEDQLEIIRATGCDEVQGYLFSPPKSLAEITGSLGTLSSKATDA
ncbi:putative bifunctional diguanylate cyclase/phosphodiesterase [Pseudaminobacter sp. NGMCC 1.201702]|uniref:putative bifunctional diguanylate cyclase/phosphodiesterase n=1 Tax=Pseudaminobacter sp. NGMCC 1.201702 TaxID=3391825 RepID=UPI0039EFF33F